MHDPASGPPLRRAGPLAVGQLGRLRPAVEDLLGAGAVLHCTEPARGWDDDVAMAAELDADHAVPVLDGPAYRRLER